MADIHKHEFGSYSTAPAFVAAINCMDFIERRA